MLLFRLSVLTVYLAHYTALVSPLPWDSIAFNSPDPPTSCPQSSWQRFSNTIINKIYSDPQSNSDYCRNGPKTSAALEWSMDEYKDYLVLRFNVSSSEEAQELSDACDRLLMDIWAFNEDWVDIALPRQRISALIRNLPKSLRNAYKPLMLEHDLAQGIRHSYLPDDPALDGVASVVRQKAFAVFEYAFKTERTEVFFQDYQPLEAINNWMRLMASIFTTYTELITVGTTYEGRPIYGLRLSKKLPDLGKPNTTRQTILITGGSHAREWVSVSSVTYAAYTMMTKYSYQSESTISSLLDAFDFVFIPTLNPDGYTHTWEVDRLWRKTRQPTSFGACKGLDLDRSYSYKWDSTHSRGNPCSASFGGEDPFEAVEANSFAHWARNETDLNGVEWVGFIDLHSYSQQVLYPYSYSCSDEPPSLENLEEVALGLTKAIRHANGASSVQYSAAPACQGNVAGTHEDKVIFPRMETGGGSALDWFYHELGVRYAYQIKLRDTGSYGFLLPKKYIASVGRDAFEAVTHLGKFLLED